MVLLGVLVCLTVMAPVGAAEPGPGRCSAVLLVAVPGTNETTAGADPGQSRGMLARVTDPLEAGYTPNQLQVVYVPYPASVVLPVLYPVSVDRGVDRAAAILTETRRACPDTQFLLAGYSQGADVAGDLAARIGRGGGPVPPETVAGVGLLAGPQYDAAASTTVGSTDGGTGVLGPRPGGFGVLADRVVQVCAEGDPVCDPLLEGGYTLGELRPALLSRAHTAYPHLVLDDTGTTAIEYLTAAATRAIEAAAQDEPHNAARTSGPPGVG